MKLRVKWVSAGMLALSGVLGASAPAAACGGFFCSQVQPVNQAAERIIFANNGDGTQTAVIEIMYEGPSEHFSWLLPISSVPTGTDIKLASDIAFQRLQSSTNPQYTLTTKVEGTCKPDTRNGGITVGVPGASTGGSGGTGGGLSVDGGGGVKVEASGVVGKFEWTALSLDKSLDDPAQAATTWLGDNGFDVPAGAPALLGPYLADGLYLLALKLTKGSDTGSIRPIMLTYKGDKPMIPVKLTAVSANDDMGVMTWVLGDSRAVPLNYLSLELNEARINWFNASLNYNSVVSAAADEAQGQGFVTELAGPTTNLANTVWTQQDAYTWQNFSTGIHSSFDEIFQTSYSYYGAFDGYWDAVQAAVTLPDGVVFDDFKLCPSCYSAQLKFSPSDFVAKLEAGVIEPMRSVQALIDAHPQITRLYTTMSADEMTLDPIFTFNADLPATSNVHTADRIIECSADLYQSDAPWRIELPQGGVVRGTATNVGVWPDVFTNQPANRVISRLSDSGTGKTIEDTGDTIDAMLDAYNATVPVPRASSGGTGGTGGTAAGATGGTATGGTGGSASGGVAGTGGGVNPNGGSADDGFGAPASSSHGCQIGPGAAGDASARFFSAGLGVLALGLLRRRRR